MTPMPEIHAHPENQRHPVKLLEIWISHAQQLPSDGSSTSWADFFSILLHQAKQPGFTSTAMFTAAGFQHPPSFYLGPHFQFSSQAVIGH